MESETSLGKNIKESVPKRRSNNPLSAFRSNRKQTLTPSNELPTEEKLPQNPEYLTTEDINSINDLSPMRGMPAIYDMIPMQDIPSKANYSSCDIHIAADSISLDNSSRTNTQYLEMSNNLNNPIAQSNTPKTSESIMVPHLESSYHSLKPSIPISAQLIDSHINAGFDYTILSRGLPIAWKNNISALPTFSTNLANSEKNQEHEHIIPLISLNTSGQSSFDITETLNAPLWLPSHHEPSIKFSIHQISFPRNERWPLKHNTFCLRITLLRAETRTVIVEKTLGFALEDLGEALIQTPSTIFVDIHRELKLVANYDSYDVLEIIMGTCRTSKSGNYRYSQFEDEDLPQFNRGPEQRVDNSISYFNSNSVLDNSDGHLRIDWLHVKTIMSETIELNIFKPNQPLSLSIEPSSGIRCKISLFCTIQMLKEPLLNNRLSRVEIKLGRIRQDRPSPNPLIYPIIALTSDISDSSLNSLLRNQQADIPWNIVSVLYGNIEYSFESGLVQAMSQSNNGAATSNLRSISERTRESWSYLSCAATEINSSAPVWKTPECQLSAAPKFRDNLSLILLDGRCNHENNSHLDLTTLPYSVKGAGTLSLSTLLDNVRHTEGECLTRTMFVDLRVPNQPTSGVILEIEVRIWKQWNSQIFYNNIRNPSDGESNHQSIVATVPDITALIESEFLDARVGLNTMCEMDDLENRVSEAIEKGTLEKVISSFLKGNPLQDLTECFKLKNNTTTPLRATATIRSNVVSPPSRFSRTVANNTACSSAIRGQSTSNRRQLSQVNTAVKLENCIEDNNGETLIAKFLKSVSQCRIVTHECERRGRLIQLLTSSISNLSNNTSGSSEEVSTLKAKLVKLKSLVKMQHTLIQRLEQNAHEINH